MKFYAVRKGREPGIYHSWEETKAQVDGFPGAEFKSFANPMDAIEFMDFSADEALDGLKKAENTFENAMAKIQRKSAQLAKNPAGSAQIRVNPGDPAVTVPVDGPYAAYVYTDGGCRNHGVHKGGHVKETDPGAWGYLIVLPDGQKFDGTDGEFQATNNKMEMTAFLESLRKLEELGLQEQAVLYSLDSQYVLNGVQHWMAGWKAKGWRKAKGEIANLDLWKAIDAEVAKFSNLHYKWVKGHDVNAGNIYVDHLLNRTMDKMEAGQK